VRTARKWEVRPKPMWARAGAAQEVWWELLRRLIPQQGQVVPGAMRARPKLVGAGNSGVAVAA
jgi:hypothetical protein